MFWEFFNLRALPYTKLHWRNKQDFPRFSSKNLLIPMAIFVAFQNSKVYDQKITIFAYQWCFFLKIWLGKFDFDLCKGFSWRIKWHKFARFGEEKIVKLSNSLE